MKNITFITGTRADYGKIKSLIKELQKKHKRFKTNIIITGMHNVKSFGNTKDEIAKDRIKNCYRFNNQSKNKNMDIVLANTIRGINKFIKKNRTDLIIVHGDRVESLAGAITGCLNNIKVSHIEGGEISGTVDEIIRHSITKLSHLHFVTNKIAKKRLEQMGEIKKNIFIIGSPDIDILLKKNLPSILSVKKRYNIIYDNYAICIFHPVTTELKKIKYQTKSLIHSLLKSKFNYFKPDNDVNKNYWFTLKDEDLLTYTGKEFSPFIINNISKQEGIYPQSKQIGANISNNHLKYALTWFSLAVSIFLIYLYFRKKNY